MARSFSTHRVAARAQHFMSVEHLLQYGPPERSGPLSGLAGQHNKRTHPLTNILRRRAISYQLSPGFTLDLVRVGPALRKTGPVAPRTAGSSTLDCTRMEANSKPILWTTVAPRFLFAIRFRCRSTLGIMSRLSPMAVFYVFIEMASKSTRSPIRNFIEIQESGPSRLAPS